MYKQKPVPLSNEGSFERIVNAGTGYRRTKARRWHRRMLWSVTAFLLLGCVNGILWLIGVLPPVLSICISEALTCAVSFLSGQLLGRCRQ